MIHQFIFAAPKPGMSEPEFQRYWVDEHAVRYASRIPQIRRYLVGTRLTVQDGDTDVPWGGVAEIWLRNDEEQLASLQSPEFVQGARADEPTWAAFWQTIGLDTERVAGFGEPLQIRPDGAVKRLVLLKRREGTPLAQFRRRSTEELVELARLVPGIDGYEQCHVRDGSYVVGESLLDAVHQMWFASADALIDAMKTEQWQRWEDSLAGLAEPRWVHTMTVQEHWIIGPQERE
jgi:hypothetical protein